MNVVVLPQTLLMFYGALVLACGGGLGIIVARQFGARRPVTSPEDPLSKSVAELRSDLEAAETELAQIAEENRFLKELVGPRLKRPIADPPRQNVA